MRTPSASAASLPCALALRIRSRTASGTETPGTSLARNSALRSETSGQMPAMIGIRNCSTRSRKRSSWSRSNTGWVMANSAPASTFQAKRLSSRSRSGRGGIDAHADHEPGRRADGVAARVESVVEPGHQVGQSDAVDVEHGGGVGVGPHLRRVAGDDQQVVEPAGRGAEQVGQHAEQVAVAAGVVDDRLEPDLALDQQPARAARPSGSGPGARRARSPRPRRPP